MSTLVQSPVTAPVVDEYLVEAVTDELALAKLLGWGNLPSIESGLRNRVMFATCHGERGQAARLSSQIMPRWRRDWDGAGELIASCRLAIDQGDRWIQVSAPNVGSWLVDPADHPTKNDAIRFAMCKAAIAYLTAASGGSIP